MRPLAPRFLVAVAACVLAFACGGVPTFGDDIAFISALDIPALAVAAGDTLRDSLGHVTPLRVHAFDVNENPVVGVTPSFVVVTLDTGIKIDANGIVTASDSLRRVQIVGRVGERLQTVAASLEVVAQPDMMVSTGTIAPLAELTPSSPLQVSITGNRKGTRVPVNGIIVRYKILATIPASPIADSLYAFTEGKRGSDLTVTADTTDGGTTSRSIVALHSLTGVDTIIVEATARKLTGEALPPVRFSIPVKKGG